MNNGSDRVTVREAATILNACDAYVQWLVQSGALRTRADEKGTRTLSREAVTRYKTGDRAGAPEPVDQEDLTGESTALVA